LRRSRFQSASQRRGGVQGREALEGEQSAPGVGRRI